MMGEPIRFPDIYESPIRTASTDLITHLKKYHVILSLFIEFNNLFKEILWNELDTLVQLSPKLHSLMVLHLFSIV